MSRLRSIKQPISSTAVRSHRLLPPSKWLTESQALDRGPQRLGESRICPPGLELGYQKIQDPQNSMSSKLDKRNQ